MNDRVFRASRRAYDTAFERINERDERETLNETELRRLQNSRVPVPMPDLAVGISEYRERLDNLAQECFQRAVRCLFVTQLSLWRPDLSVDSQRLLGGPTVPA